MLTGSSLEVSCFDFLYYLHLSNIYLAILAIVTDSCTMCSARYIIMKAYSTQRTYLAKASYVHIFMHWAKNYIYELCFAVRARTEGNAL